MKTQADKKSVKDIQELKQRFTKFSIGLFAILTLSITLLASAYTYILQKSYTDIALETELKRDMENADAIHKLVNEKIGREEFATLRHQSDENTEMYHKVSSFLNEIRTLNSTRYLYTATRNEENRLIYVVDGLDPNAGDVRHPGDYIEEEMIPYINKALSGETVYSQNIVDTTWGPIFTACYPVTGDLTGDSDEIVGALCIEMDMQSVNGLVKRTRRASVYVGAMAGCVLFLLCAVCFIGYKRKREDEIEQTLLLREAAEKAETANRAKSSFLLNMSHDIRSPMNAIIGFTDIALNQTNVSEIHDSLQKVKISSEHLLFLLNNVLDLSRIENGKVSFSPEPENLPVLIDNVIAIVDGLLLNRDLTFEIHRNIPKELYVLTDATKIREILTNLLSNSVKFTKDGGTITFEISIKPGIDERHIVSSYAVKDNGIGMSEEYLPHIYEEFSREHSTTENKVPGTGLGLPIIKSMIELMGGSIQVESRQGIGTKFTIDLSFDIALKEEVYGSEDTIESSAIHTIKGKRILLVEDNELNAEIAKTVLEDVGALITRAENGQQALELFKEKPAGTFDVILMDLMMPVMDGYTATRKIRELERSDAKTVPIIAMTANAFQEDAEKCIAVGMNAHLAKPLDIEKMKKTIKSICS